MATHDEERNETYLTDAEWWEAEQESIRAAEREEQDRIDAWNQMKLTQYTVTIIYHDLAGGVCSYTVHTAAPTRDDAVLCARYEAEQAIGNQTDRLFPLEDVAMFLVLPGHVVPDIYERDRYTVEEGW